MSHLMLRKICMKQLIIISLILLGITPVFPRAHALTYRAASLEQAVRRADLIVDVTISDRETVTRGSPHDAKNKRLFTLNTAKVSLAIKGTASGTLTIVQSGGTRAGITSMTPGTPQLKTGERWILFLRRTPNQKAEWIITGGTHGARRVMTRGSDGVKMIHYRVKTPRLKLHSPGLRKIKLAPNRFKHLSKSTLNVRPQPGSQAKIKVKPKIQAKPRVQVKPKAQAKPKAQVKPLSEYIEQLKTLVDRSQAPVNPTH